MPTALLWSSPSPPTSDSGFHASSRPLHSPVPWSGQSAPTLILRAWPPAWGARMPIAAPSFGAYLAVPSLPSSTHMKLKKKKNYPYKMPFLQIGGKKKKIFTPYTPARARGRRAPAEEPLGAGSIQPGMAPQACPGAWRSAPPPLAVTPLPRNPRCRSSLTKRVNGSAGQGHLGVRRAEEPSRSSAAAERWGSESPDKARDGEAERRLMASPTRRAPPAPLRPPASAQRGAAPSARPSEPPRRRRLPGHPGLAWPLRLLRAA